MQGARDTGRGGQSARREKIAQGPRGPKGSTGAPLLKGRGGPRDKHYPIIRGGWIRSECWGPKWPGASCGTGKGASGLESVRKHAGPRSGASSPGPRGSCNDKQVATLGANMAWGQLRHMERCQRTGGREDPRRSAVWSPVHWTIGFTQGARECPGSGPQEGRGRPPTQRGSSGGSSDGG